MAIDRFLFDYRSAPHCTTGKSPALLFVKRELKTRFELLRPSTRERVNVKQQAQIASNPHSYKIKLNVGDEVMIDNYVTAGERRIPAEIVSKRSPSTFEVKTESGSVTKRHVDQIIKPVRRSPRIASRQTNDQESEYPL